MSGRTLGEQLADFASGSSYSDLPEAVVESVKMRLLDTLGIAVAAAGLDSSRAARRWAVEQAGAGHASAVGVEDKLPANLAAFVNGVLMHSLDYDDTHLPSVLHPSASVVPAALAAAERAGADGPRLIHAVAVGLEACVRLGMAGYDEESGSSTFFEHGQHATSICGAMGGAVAASVLAGRPDRVVHALGVAASMASGIIEGNRTGGTIKRLHCGWAAHAAVSAGELSDLGITGPPTVLEGRFGFFQAWLHGRFDADAVTKGLGDVWSVPDIFFKPYPANHFTHTIVDATSALRRRGIDPSRIDRLTVGVPAPIVRTIGEPIEVKRSPETGYMAQFSGPYAAAVGLFGGGGLGASLEDYTDELAGDPARRALMQRVDIVADDRCTKIFPHQFPAIVTALLTDGETVVEEVLTNKGGPDRPLSFAALSQKFHSNVDPHLTAEAASAVTGTCRRLEEVAHVSELISPLRAVDLQAAPVPG
ncbi:MmgE/PrpD family protein [Nocardioides bigeumensis]|uniref:MmgE/PrpD family protein n=1 Tax=Nocardioides bigeumensis TaxID=433657 RepID=A0ABN2YA28_9ACTN